MDSLLLDEGWLAQWGRFVHRHRGKVLVGALVLCAASLSLFALPTAYTDPNQPTRSTEAGRAAQAIMDNIPEGGKPSMILILTDRGRPWTDPGFKSDAEAALAPLHEDARVASVLSAHSVPPEQAQPLVSEDGHRVLAIVTLDQTLTEAQKSYGEVRSLVHSERLEVIGTGGLAQARDGTLPQLGRR